VVADVADSFSFQERLLTMLQAKARTAFRGMLLAAVVLCLGAPPAQAQTTLRYKFKLGDMLNYELQQKMEMKMSLAGNDIAINMNQQIGMTWKVLKMSSGDKVQVLQKIESIRMTMDTPMGKVEYDSKNGKEPEGPIGKALGPVFNALAGSEFTVTMDTRGEISDVEVPAKLLAVLKDKLGAVPGLGEMFSADNLKHMINQGGLVLAKGPVTKGDTWTQNMNTKMPFGTMKVTNTMTYEGPAAGGQQKIAMSPVVSLDADPNSPVTIKMKGGTGKGEAVFDNAAGRVVEVNITQNMQMEISASGQDITQNIRTTTVLKLKK
jgi:hypothetical protein